MRILFIDTAVDGHHITYLKHLIESLNGADVIAFLPEKVSDLSCDQYTYHPVDMYNKKLRSFLSWIQEITQKAKEVKPDLIHILTGDSFVKYFGLGLRKLRDLCPVVVTFHWLREGKLQLLSRRTIAKNCDYMVVHSEYLLEKLLAEGIDNSQCIEYPQFYENEYKTDTAKEELGLSLSVPVIAAIGNTREDKGLDLLLKSLKSVKSTFQLLIAGKEESFDKDYVLEEAAEYKDHVHLFLRYLTDKEFQCAIAAADIVVLPYRRIFNGASGPLVEGAHLGKCIIGSSHGNLGDTIKRNHLGYTFETENIDDLCKKIEIALSSHFEVDDIYKEYQRQIDPDVFSRKYKSLYNLALRRKN